MCIHRVIAVSRTGNSLERNVLWCFALAYRKMLEGEEDHWMPLKQTCICQKKLPHNSPDVGHVSMEEMPLKTVKDVLSFLGD